MSRRSAEVTIRKSIFYSLHFFYTTQEVTAFSLCAASRKNISDVNKRVGCTQIFTFSSIV